ncbi:hypothetical protein ACFL6N_03615 [Thermodesulfobacteriota bacterium]
MAFTMRQVEYYFTTVKDQPGEAYELLSLLEDMGVNLLAFTAVPVGPNSTQLTLFPEDPLHLKSQTGKSGMTLDGPHLAILVQGDDELGALVEIHRKIFEAQVNVYASSGVADNKGSYGYLIYVKPDDFERAAQALNL